MKAAELLYQAFATTRIHGRKDIPEDVRPAGVERESLEHILFITLTVSIDYQRERYNLEAVPDFALCRTKDANPEFVLKLHTETPD